MFMLKICQKISILPVLVSLVLPHHTASAQPVQEEEPAPEVAPQMEPGAPGVEEDPELLPEEGEPADAEEAEATAPRFEEEIEPPTLRELVNSLSSAEIQLAINALRENYIEKGALNELDLNRAAIEGLLLRLGYGALLEQAEIVAAREKQQADPQPAYSQKLGETTYYARPGSFDEQTARWLEERLREAREQEARELILDLRDTPHSADYQLAANLADLLVEKGRPLLGLTREPEGDPEQIFTSKNAPIFQGLLLVLTDTDTGGAAEALSAVLRDKAGAMIVGAPTQDRAVLYDQVKLGDGRVLRIATGRVVVAGGEPVFPGGVTPDVEVSMPEEIQETIFDTSQEDGMGGFVFEEERPRLNEAALVAGRNPEIDMIRRIRNQARSEGEMFLRDLVLQRALDLIITLRLYADSPYLQDRQNGDRSNDEPDAE
jgi:hypothetical protein